MFLPTPFMCSLVKYNVEQVKLFKALESSVEPQVQLQVSNKLKLASHINHLFLLTRKKCVSATEH